MLKVKTISVNYERKINLGNYESATIGVTMWADVDEEEDLNDAMHALWDMAKENVKAQALPLKKGENGNVNLQDFFLGLPIQKQEN